MLTILLLLTAGAAVWFGATFVPPREHRERRVIWRETDARARQRIAERWEPPRRKIGPWCVKRNRENKP